MHKYISKYFYQIFANKKSHFLIIKNLHETSNRDKIFFPPIMFRSTYSICIEYILIIQICASINVNTINILIIILTNTFRDKFNQIRL